MKENQSIEWKQSWRDEYLKWICGFANARGGTLVIGKNDKGEVLGVANSAKLLADIPNKVRDILGMVVPVNLHSDGGKDWRAGYIESWWRGIEKINRECREHDIAPPLFDYGMSGLMLTFRANPQYLAACRTSLVTH